MSSGGFQISFSVTRREVWAHLRKVFCLLILKKKKGEEREDLQKRRGPGGVSWEDPRVGVRRKCGAERLEESCWSRKGLGEGAACLSGEKRSEEEKPRVKFRWDGEAEGTARAARRP